LLSLLKAYGDAYSAAVNLRVPDYPRSDPHFGDRAAAPDKAPRRGRGWLNLLTAFY
jgi:hypothetical protein